MEDNKHEIKTIEDVLRVVNSKNKENFLKDFSAWLDINIQIKEKIIEEFGKVVNLSEEDLKEQIKVKQNLIWIDDGKNDIKVDIRIKEELTCSCDECHIEMSEKDYKKNKGLCYVCIQNIQ